MSNNIQDNERDVDEVPLLEEEAETITCSSGTLQITNQSLWPILGTIFHPTYMMVNAVLLGRLKIDKKLCPDTLTAKQKKESMDCVTDEQYLAAFGIGSAVIGMLVFATIWCYAAALSNKIPQAFGSKNYEMIGVHLNRMVILVLCIFTPILVPLWFSYYLFNMFVDHRVALLASEYVKIVSIGGMIN